jgi:hypothetical protein
MEGISNLCPQRLYPVAKGARMGYSAVVEEQERRERGPSASRGSLG